MKLDHLKLKNLNNLKLHRMTIIPLNMKINAKQNNFNLLKIKRNPFSKLILELITSNKQIIQQTPITII